MFYTFYLICNTNIFWKSWFLASTQSPSTQEIRPWPSNQNIVWYFSYLLFLSLYAKVRLKSYVHLGANLAPSGAQNWELLFNSFIQWVYKKNSPSVKSGIYFTVAMVTKMVDKIGIKFRNCHFGPNKAFENRFLKNKTSAQANTKNKLLKWCVPW